MTTVAGIPLWLADAIGQDGSVEGTFDKDGHGTGWMHYKAKAMEVQLDCTLSVTELRELADYIEGQVRRHVSEVLPPA